MHSGSPFAAACVWDSGSTGSAMMEIRDATSRDSQALASIGIRSWESAVVGWGENTEALRSKAHAAYRDFCTNQWSKILIAHDGSLTFGWGAREKLDDNITDLWIDPEHQGKGAGTLLLATMERHIAEAGFTESVLETHAKNEPAIGFYERYGYRVVSLAVGYSNSLEQDIQVVTMRRSLDDLSPDKRKIP